MLRTRLFLSFAALILLFGILSAWFGVGAIRGRIMAEAQNRVELDIASAWSIYDAELREIQTVVTMEAGMKRLVDACAAGEWTREGLVERLELVRSEFGLDFLSLTDPEGKVVLRSAPPYTDDGSMAHRPLVGQALKGRTVSGTLLLSAVELQREAEGLDERAFLVLEDTQKARPTPRTAESRGMVMAVAVPVMRGPQVFGVLYGGMLLNRNKEIVDRIKEVIYSNDQHEGSELGTATIFLKDGRVTTTVRLASGLRALGTRVSKEVADQVLDNGKPWIGRAFVVKDWYLTAYDPIKDLNDEVIGMLYVGILESPFIAMGRSIVWRYVFLTCGVVALSLAVAYFVAGWLARPIHQLVVSARQMHRGNYPDPVSTDGASEEIGNLIEAFNEMCEALREREQSLNTVNLSLQKLNRNYMETLGFVTHELNTPIASTMNYVYLLKNGLIGGLNEKQEKAVKVIDHSTRRLLEMVRHYLNLSRIEKGDLHLHPKEIGVRKDILEPLRDGFDPFINERGMRLEMEVDPETVIHADLNLTREVFENLLSNAIKYGKEGGTILVRAWETGDGRVSFAVRNEGKGIPPEKHDRLFRRFSRLEDDEESDPSQQKGTGLGLFITRHVVEAHGGKISVDSHPGQWTEFKFTLPASADEGSPEPERPELAGAKA